MILVAELLQFMGAVMGPTQPTQRMLLVTSQQRLRLRIFATGFQLSTYYGGVQYGNIGGKVTNDISGYGRWYTAGQRFIGGSSVAI